MFVIVPTEPLMYIVMWLHGLPHPVLIDISHHSSLRSFCLHSTHYSFLGLHLKSQASVKIPPLKSWMTREVWACMVSPGISQSCSMTPPCSQLSSGCMENWQLRGKRGFLDSSKVPASSICLLSRDHTAFGVSMKPRLTAWLLSFLDIYPLPKSN